ncbi:CoA transferase subunit A [Natranaerobius thermophilus]|uniref:Butyryl-CoA:acetoacetate CoA-transferase alpha subunit n=1 Tax=Natranaerobius thermophilus (strain ATCC BAA-1301 / DSM 18059 / JW/NM-WN-LF) TaxID=457570 RepID=B2A846_NATTJ|nr:3-oxoacid CoA-transferase subunit A [Natranaerobius thermophilus]ACB85814.1 butyryl-CoA:acetoacetate CoA-transferase alpha subunit [Natranaerobius thermophilus JW/NM-WN-LF]
MKQILSAKESVEKIFDGMTVMIGGFLATGTPETLVDALEDKGVKDLTLIANDTSYPEKGIGRLVVNDQFSKVFVSHIGTNKYTGEKMHNDELDVNLVPQGTLAEQIRAGGAGLGGILTPTGIGTVAEEGKQKIKINRKDYILAESLTADVALIKAEQADEFGNLRYRLSARNFNPLMAKAAKIVIAEVGSIEPASSFDPDDIHTPSVYVDYLVKREEG